MVETRQQLRITARLGGPICLPGGSLHLDALLCYAVVQERGPDRALDVSMLDDIEIPVEREPDGRFHLCSTSLFEVEAADLQYTNRRPPVEQYQTLGVSNPKLRRVQINLGANKAYRIPRHVEHLVDDRIEWFAVGNGSAIRALLEGITHLGKRRGVGLGKVLEWAVDPYESWGEGFPVVRDGKPLRPLPTDWDGAEDSRAGFGCITYPYYDHAKEDLCLLPQ
jgi:CRISPR type IV-associated protein Csf3